MFPKLYRAFVLPRGSKKMTYRTSTFISKIYGVYLICVVVFVVVVVVISGVF